MVVSEKVVPLHPQFRNAIKILGYGVMVTLQILVLPFLVRVRVPQQIDFPITYKSSGWDFSFTKLSSNYRSISESSVFEKNWGCNYYHNNCTPYVLIKLPLLAIRLQRYKIILSLKILRV